MKYISIDIETTGLDPENNQILEFGAVIEDTNADHAPGEFGPDFRRMIVNDGDLTIGSYCIQLNYDLILEIDNLKVINEAWFPDSEEGLCKPQDLLFQFLLWLDRNGFRELALAPANDIVAAGKNFTGFDLPFLVDVDSEWANVFHRRVLDPAILFVDWFNDGVPPRMDDACKRGGIPLEGYHTAVGDAKTVINMIRTGTGMYQNLYSRKAVS